MKRILAAMLLAVSGLLASLAVAQPASAAQGALAGTWVSVDVGDGSDQVLSIVGSGVRNYSVFYVDHAATVCGGAPAKVVGTGKLQGDVLQTVGTLTCKPGGNVFRARIGIAYEYDAGTDTLTDEFGNVWTR